MKQYTLHFSTLSNPNPSTDVPCGECNACCILSPLLTAEEFESGKYMYTFMKHGNLEVPVVAIPRNKNGCMYKIDNKCSIYEDRPLSCRQFDCRKGHYPPLKQLALDKFGVYNEA